jgi:hypothetical protein
MTLNFTAKNDQCATAAEIYQCSQKKDSAFTNALIKDNKGASTVCGKISSKIFGLTFLISFKCLWISQTFQNTEIVRCMIALAMNA